MIRCDALRLLHPTALTADKLVNTGYVISGGGLAIDADQLANTKRSSYFYEKRKVKGGKQITEGDIVQPGGFIQAARWSLSADEVRSRSGEFRVLAADEAATEAASAAFVEQIADALGEDFHFEQAQDRLKSRFIANQRKGGLGGLIGAVVAVVVAIVAAPAVSAWIAGAAGATGTAATGSAWAAATAGAGAGIANVAATSFVTGTLGSAAGQLAATGKIDLDAALRNGAVSGLTAGITGAAFGQTSADSLAGIANQGGTLQPVVGGGAEWADRLLGIGARGVIGAGIQSAVNGTSFDAALRDALVGDLAALGANRIGTHLDGVDRALAHAALGAISAELKGQDPAAGAIGALSSALAAGPIDEALGLSGTSRQAAVSALAMLSGGLLSDALGHDPVTAANAALNEVTNNYLKHDEAVELQRLRERCAFGRCTDAERAEIKRLELLDRTRNQQLESACRNPGSLDCQTAYLDLARALSGYGGKRIEPGSVSDRELSELVSLDGKFRQRISNATGYNATTGASETLAQGLAATVELALLTVKAAFGDADAQRRLGALIDAAGEFVQHPIDSTERAIKSTLDEADRLEAVGRSDEAQRLRAGLVTDGVLAITGAGAVVVKGSGRVLGTLSRAEGSAFDSVVVAKGGVGADEAVASQTVGNLEPDNPLSTSLSRNGDRLVLNQGNLPTCGPTSCAMVLDTAGKSVDLGSLITQSGVTAQGTTLPRLSSTLNSNGLSATYARGVTVEDLAAATANGDPAIVAMNLDRGGHAVVVDGVTIRNGQTVVAIRDPALGRQYFTPIEEFRQKFYNEAIFTKR